MASTALLGMAYDHWGWPACVARIGAALAVAAPLGATPRRYAGVRDDRR